MKAPLPNVLFHAPNGRFQRLAPGDLVGRLPSAALSIDDPRVSEAHAMLSLRDQGFKLLALRGSLGCGGRWLAELELVEGQRVLLAEGVELEVVEVCLPRQALALEDATGQRVALDRPELALRLQPLALERGEGAEARVEWHEGVWQLLQAGAPPLPLREGVEFGSPQRPIRVVALPLPSLGTAPTIDSGRIWPPLRIQCWAQHSEIAVMGRKQRVRLTRNPHAILRESALRTQGGGSVHWLEVAEAIWRVNANEDNWYTNLARLRDKLRREGLPPDLVRCEGGQVSLGLRQVDSLELLDLP